MKIGYDAKRAFQNKTGLGNYARSLITSLAGQYPQHQYNLYTPKLPNFFDTTIFKNVAIKGPQKSFDKQFTGWWRRSSMVKDIEADGINIFHGVSNELPWGIDKTATKTVITVHDLIFERYPGTYHFDERYTHRWKMKQSCKIADAVIATSQQTKEDLINFYKIPAEKIFVCYQNCNPVFEKKVSEAEKAIVKKRYHLPDQYFLFVSSITKRKNLITVCKGLQALKNKMDIPLLVIGDGKKEKAVVKLFLQKNGLEKQVIFLNELPVSKEDGFVKSTDFPAIYQQALALVYPSYFEGFGIPLLEALWSGLPVIASNTSSLPEVGGDAALYFSPNDSEMLAGILLQLSSDKALAENLKIKGLKQASRFTPQKHAKEVMDIYLSII